jgi:hypothetical protein
MTPLGISKLLRSILASKLHQKDQCSSAVIPGARRPWSSASELALSRTHKRAGDERDLTGGYFTRPQWQRTGDKPMATKRSTSKKSKQTKTLHKAKKLEATKALAIKR